MKPKVIRVHDPNDVPPSTGDYTPDNFRAWVHEVFMEGYKRDVPFPSLDEAMRLVESFGCVVTLDPK